MNRLIIILLVIFLVENVRADLGGDKRIDSLESEIPNGKGDSNQVRLYNSLSFHYSSRNTDIGIEYAQKALQLAKKIKWKHGLLSAYNSLGINYDVKSDYPKSLKYYLMAFKEIEDTDKLKSKAVLLNNIGTIYQKRTDYEKALEYFRKSLENGREAEYQRAILLALHNIGSTLSQQGNNSEALKYLNESLQISEEIDDRAFMSYSMSSIGAIYSEQSEFSKSMGYFERGLSLCKELNNKSGIAGFFINIGDVHYKLALDSEGTTLPKSNENTNFNQEINLIKAIKNYQDAILIYEEIGALDEKSNGFRLLAKAYEQRGNHQKRADALEQFMILKDSIFTKEKAKEIANLTSVREKEVAQKELRIQKLENIKQRNEGYALYGGLAIFAVVLFIFYKQRKRSETLLLGILPATIAKRLKKKEHPIADHFDEASIIFIDIVGFTAMSSGTKAEKIVEVLDSIFNQFDVIGTKHGLEKIKTIGDSYMAVAGVPIPDPNHATNMANFALEVKESMNNYKTSDGTMIQFRFGIACGDVVAGVIGTNKFIYDLWGDTVNIASRMESNGIPGKIHVTKNFRDKLSSSFHFEERGEIEIKGKGKMKTYFIGERKV